MNIRWIQIKINLRMKHSRKKMLTVTCSHNIKKRVDSFLDKEYSTWRNQRSSLMGGIFKCSDDTSNSLLMEYVRYIYSEYGIKDPLPSENPEEISAYKPKIMEEESPIKSIHSTQIRGNRTLGSPQRVVIHRPPPSTSVDYTSMNRVSRNEPRFSMGKSFATPRQTINYHERHSSEFGKRNGLSETRLVTQESRLNRQMTGSRANVHFLYGNSRSKKGEESTPFKQLSPQQMSDEQRRKIRQEFQSALENKQSKIKESQSLMRFSRKINSMTLRKDQPVPEVYRYCLACEEAILESNIQRHQILCQHFNKMYELNLGGMLSHLTQKIEGIKEKLQFHSDALGQEDPRNMKRLSHELRASSVQILRTGELSKQFVQNYNSAMGIGKKWSETSQSVNKLRWFIRVREQLKKHFNV